MWYDGMVRCNIALVLISSVLPDLMLSITFNPILLLFCPALLESFLCKASSTMFAFLSPECCQGSLFLFCTMMH